MYRNYITSEDLNDYIKALKKLQLAMNRFEIEKLSCNCNTYGMTGDMLSIAGVGFLPIYKELDDYADYQEFNEVEGYSGDDMRWELEQADYEYEEDYFNE